MAYDFKKIIRTDLAKRLAYWIIRAYSRLFFLKIENEKQWIDHLENGGTVLLCCYHQQFFPIIRHSANYGKYNLSVMISRSNDGEMAAGVAQLFGLIPVRGSSSRGGAVALKQMIRNMKINGLGAHIVDGPRGPAGVIKPGIIRMAHATDAVIVPFYTAADRSWFFNSWDRFFIPKPFSRAVVRFGDMIKLDKTKDPEKFENQRKLLEDTMNRENRRLWQEILGPEHA